MHTIIRASILVALFAALLEPALAQDISGTWKAVVELDVGSGEPTFVFKQEGEQITAPTPARSAEPT